MHHGLAMRQLRLGADVNCISKWMDNGVQRSLTPLIGASLQGYARMVADLIESGADVNKPEPCDGDSQMTLQDAVQTGRVIVMKILYSLL